MGFAGSSGFMTSPELLVLDVLELDEVELEDVELLELELEVALLEADELDEDDEGLGLLSEPPPELQAAKTELKTKAEKSPLEIWGSANSRGMRVSVLFINSILHIKDSLTWR